MSNFRTPLSQVKGHGSAKEGTAHFWMQRVTAIAMVPLVLWLCFSVASLPGMSQEEIRGWLSGPITSVLMVLLILVGFYHAKLGLQMVIEDYIGNHGLRTAIVIGVTMVCAFFAVLGVFSVMRIAFA